MDVDSVKTNKTIRLAFAAAVAIIVTYSASTQWAWLTALAPMAAEASIDPLAAARYQEYAPRDFTGERAIAENALPWQHETWSGDNTPYQKARQEIDSAVAIGKSPMHLARQYEAQADKNRKGPLDQFRWGYALWRTITPTSTSAEKQTNKLGIFFALSKIASPNTYDYARLQSIPKVVSLLGTPGGTRAKHRPSSYSPGSSPASSPSGSTGPASGRATRTCARRPSAGPGASSRPARLSSLRRCAGCAPGSRAPPPPDALARCHSLCPDTGAAEPPPWGRGVPRRWHPASPPAAGGRLCWPLRCKQKAGRLAPRPAGSA